MQRVRCCRQLPQQPRSVAAQVGAQAAQGLRGVGPGEVSPRVGEGEHAQVRAAMTTSILVALLALIPVLQSLSSTTVRRGLRRIRDRE